MSLRIGIVGLPNAGKSTLFNALLKKQVAFAANYPFATIEPNKGIVPVHDGRLTALAGVVEQDEGVRPPEVYTTVEFVDIAGLVKGASQGQGLGNKFLSHIREVHLICHVIRYFPDPDIIHVAGGIEPLRDRDIIETELALADLDTLQKQPEPRGVKDTDVQKRWSLIKQLIDGLNLMQPARSIITDGDDRQLVSDLHLLTMKPVLYVGNVSEDQLVHGTANAPEPFLPVSAKIESELASMEEAEQTEYLRELGVEHTGLDRLITKSYDMLGLISFLTAGVKEVRAWTVRDGTTAQKASGTIHTDFEKKFIKADVIGFSDFVEAGGWTNARSVGKVRQEGRGYRMRDGDVVEFKIGA